MPYPYKLGGGGGEYQDNPTKGGSREGNVPFGVTLDSLRLNTENYLMYWATVKLYNSPNNENLAVGCSALHITK